MTEDKYNELRQKDVNLREAFKLDEAECPQMPADLNERLMQRMEKENRKPRLIVWPWVAAACVAAALIVWLTPPKEVIGEPSTGHIAKVEIPTPEPEDEGLTPEEPKIEQPVETPEKPEVQQPVVTSAKPKTQKPATQIEPQLMAQATADAEIPAEVSTPLPSGEGQGEGSVALLTENDIPITRPENFKHTPEEIALMKRQAEEAYLKWVELELEIAKYNLEQTAQK